MIQAFRYGDGVDAGQPDPWLRWTAVGVFVIAALSDALDGWVARRFDQRSPLGAFLDPLADKLLMGHGVLVGALVDWGQPGWHLPMWFAIVVWSRDAVVSFGIWYLHHRRVALEFRPHWSGKVATVTQMVALGWVMLGWIDFAPLWPCLVAAVLTAWSGVAYVRQGLAMLARG